MSDIGLTIKSCVGSSANDEKSNENEFGPQTTFFVNFLFENVSKFVVSNVIFW